MVDNLPQRAPYLRDAARLEERRRELRAAMVTALYHSRDYTGNPGEQLRAPKQELERVNLDLVEVRRRLDAVPPVRHTLTYSAVAALAAVLPLLWTSRRVARRWPLYRMVEQAKGRRNTGWKRRFWSPLSLALFVIVCVLWERSYRNVDGLQYRSQSGPCDTLHTRFGGFHYIHTGPPEGSPPGFRVLGGRQPLPGRCTVDSPSSGWLGVRMGRVSTSSFVSVPAYFVLLCTAFIPAVSLLARVRQNRQQLRGLCRCCSYDLRGNESGVCPECGTPLNSCT